jgi:hypothetical protein
MDEKKRKECGEEGADARAVHVNAKRIFIAKAGNEGASAPEDCGA